MIIKDSIRFVIASIAMVFFVLFGCGSRAVYAETSVPTPKMEKSITCTDKENDIYELSLSMTPTSETITHSEPLDVIFIADVSGSMKGSRLEALKKALTADGGLIESVLASSNNRLSIISFAGGTSKTDSSGNESRYNDAKTVLSWSSSTDIAKQKAKELAVPSNGDTGTNISAGLYKAEQVLKSARDTAKKVIVLLTDGAANMYYDDKGYTKYESNNPSEGFVEKINESLESEVNKLKAHNLDGFYSIAFADTTAVSSLTTIQNAWKGTLDDNNNQVLLAEDQEELIKRFKEITDTIIVQMFKQVVITDVLSDWVELLPDDASDIRLVVASDGKEKELGKDIVTFETKTNADNKTEISAIFDEEYQFVDDCQYILRFKVQVSQAGHDKFADEGCDTLPSNTKATVSYHFGDEGEQVVTYEQDPQVNNTSFDVPITIIWEAIDESQIAKNIKAVLKKTDTDTEADYRKTEVVPEEWKNSFKSVAKGHTYDVEAPDVEGFTKTVENVGTEAKPNFIVTYRQNPTLTIKKVLEGLDGEDSSKTFNIEVEAWDSEGAPLHATYGTTIFKNGKATVEVKANGEVKIPYLPRGTNYTVKESDASSEGYTVSYDKEKGTLDNENVVVTVTNTKLPSLTISKTVEGAYGDKEKDFTFNITLEDENGVISGEFQAEKGDETTTVTFTEGKASVELKHGESITITDLPFEASYEVSEDTTKLNNNYTVTYNGEKKESVAGVLSENIRIDVVNTMTEITSTGGNSSHGSAIKLGIFSGLAILVGLVLVARKVKKDEL